MQGHKKLIPELKLNDNLRKLRGGVTPTPTPTPSADNVKFYNLDVTVEYNPLIKQYVAQSSDTTLYNKINADYQQYGDNALYCIDVQVTDDEDNTFNVFLFLRNNDGKYFAASYYDNANYDLTLTNGGFSFTYYLDENYSHTEVFIEGGLLKVYNDIDGEYVYSEDAVSYLINNIISIYGTNTELLFTNDTETGFCTLNNTSHITLNGNLVYIVSGYKGDKPISLILYRNVQTSKYSWHLNGGSVEWYISQGDMNVYDKTSNAVLSSSFYNLLNLITTNGIQNIKFNLHVDVQADLTDYVKHPITFTEWSLQNNSNVNCMTSTVYVAALEKHITIFIHIEDNPASYVYYQVV